MDFKALLRPARFGKQSAADVPDPTISKSTSRRLAELAEAAGVLKVLPGPGESLHAIMTGRYDLCDLLDAVLSRIGPALGVRIATLSLNGRNVETMRGWVSKRGRVRRLTVLCSKFFREHNPEIFKPLWEMLRPPHHVAASRNHCKVVCFEFADGQKMALEGSANLRTNSNREQFCLVNDAGLHDWHAAWIDAEVSKHETETPRDKA